MAATARRATSGARCVAAVSVRNDATSIGIVVDGEVSGTWQITTQPRLTADEAYAALCSAVSLLERTGQESCGAPCEDSVLASVVPDASASWQQALRRLTSRRPLTIGPGIKTGFAMRYRDPAEVGADRIADIAGALSLCEPPFIVVDLGATTTFEVVDGHKAYLGGVIAPGVELGARALAREMAKLPVIEVRAPKKVVGTSTREAMQSGVVWGEIARIDGLIDRICSETGLKARIIVTGRDASATSGLLSHDAVCCEDLMLKGLASLYAINRA